MRIKKFDHTLHSITSNPDELTITDYLVTAFKESDTIDVLVGYFRISFFEFLAPLLALIFNSEKTIRIICGHQLSGDEERLIFAEKNRDNLSQSQLDQILSRIWRLRIEAFEKKQLREDVITLMHEMMKRKQLCIKPVIVRHDAQDDGLFHQKEYIFQGKDWASRAIGSANMTASMLSKNSESLEVRYHETPEEITSLLTRLNFIEALWENNAPYHFQASKADIVRDELSRTLQNEGKWAPKKVELTVISLLKDVKSHCTKYNSIEISNQIEALEKQAESQGGITLRPHQRRALDEWEKSNYLGLLEMATGAGKTITAIQGIEELNTNFDRKHPIFVLVPSKALVDQWHQEITKFFPSTPTICSTGEYRDREWKSVLKIKLRMWGKGNDEAFPVMIGVYSTVLALIKSWKGKDEYVDKGLENALLIADECHSLGAPRTSRAFENTFFRYRIGLSATPDRYMDEESTAFVRKTFNGFPESTFEYSLSDAIEDGFLVPYNYYPIPFVLDESTQEKYQQISEKISNLSFAEDNTPAGDALKSLLIARVRLIMKSPAKKVAFKNWLNMNFSEGNPDLNAMIVYSPEGYGTDYDDSRILEEYQSMLHHSGLRTSSFIGDNEGHNKNQDSPLDVFQRGGIDALIAMKCLDEGVDLPRATCGVFLSSTGNPRQYIQRRGRLIRTYTSPNGVKKMKASVVDFICLPRIDLLHATGSSSGVEESILRRELSRAAHFSNDALNQSQAESDLHSILTNLGYSQLWKEELVKNK